MTGMNSRRFVIETSEKRGSALRTWRENGFAADFFAQRRKDARSFYLSINAITWPSGSLANRPLLKPRLLSFSDTTPGETRREFSASKRFANESAVLTIRLVCQ